MHDICEDVIVWTKSLATGQCRSPDRKTKSLDAEHGRGIRGSLTRFVASFSPKPMASIIIILGAFFACIAGKPRPSSVKQRRRERKTSTVFRPAGSDSGEESLGEGSDEDVLAFELSVSRS